MSAVGTVTGEDRERAQQRERGDYSAGLRHAEAAYDALLKEMQAIRPDERAIYRQTADMHARLSQTYALRDQARSQRQLAQAEDRLSVSVDALVDELRAARGVARDAS